MAARRVLLAAGLMAVAAASQAQSVSLHGVMGQQAMLVIDGKTHVVAAGRSVNGEEASQARLHGAGAVAVAPSGDVYVVDVWNAKNPDIQVIGADPAGSVYSGGTGRPYLVEGVGEDFWPEAYDRDVADRIIEVSDADSFAFTRRLAMARLQHHRTTEGGGRRLALLPGFGADGCSTTASPPRASTARAIMP